MVDRLFMMLGQSFMLLVILYIQVKVPKFTNSNILLGVKIPKDKVEDEELNAIHSNYKKELIFIGLLLTTIFTFIGYFKNLLEYIYLIQIIYVLSLFLVYLKYNKKVKAVKHRERWSELAENIRVTDIKYSRERENIKNIFTWSKIPSLILLTNIVLSIYMYPKLPNRIPAFWGFSSINPYVYKTPWTVFSGIVLQVFIITIVYLSYYSISRARIDIDPDNVEGSINLNRKYVNKWSNILLGNLIAIQLIFTYLNMHVLGFVKISGTVINIFKIFSYIVVIVNVYLVNKIKFDIDDFIIEEIKARRYYIEDDDLWKLGNTIYHNPNDPAIFVKSRFGPGHTVNTARPLGKIIAVLTIGIICLAAIIVINKNFLTTIVNIILN